MERELTEPTVRRLTGVGQDLVAELDLEQLLDTILERAVEITEARYAALGVLDESRSGLERFLHRGIDESIRERIGELPSGRGVLGTLISEPRVLRLRDVSEHHESFGFPPHHPPMKTFLGVPISVFGQPWGNLYLTEKRGRGGVHASRRGCGGGALTVGGDRDRQCPIGGARPAPVRDGGGRAGARPVGS